MHETAIRVFLLCQQKVMDAVKFGLTEDSVHIPHVSGEDPCVEVEGDDLLEVVSRYLIRSGCYCMMENTGTDPTP